MKKIVLIVVVLAAAGAGIFALQRRPAVPRVPFAKTVRETLSSVLSTNGKVEPVEYVQVRVEAPGLVKGILVKAGDTVRSGQMLATLSQPGLSDELASAEARLAQARAELQTLEAGGRSADVSDVEASLRRARSERQTAQHNLESLERLLNQQAATRYDADQARQAVANLDLQITSLEQKRTALVGKGDIAGAQARVKESEANVDLARSRIASGVIRSPTAGTVYDLPARPGSYLATGDPLASIGKLDPVHVRVYVDEPELGRVAPGEMVRITWDALPGREWTGVVEKRPTEVIALGTRQVGEVLCTINNPGRELVPGTNVNAFILTEVSEHALTIPKAAIRHDKGTGVYVLEPDNVIKWQQVQSGISDALRTAITGGLKDGDAVALASDQPLRDGEKVDSYFP